MTGVQTCALPIAATPHLALESSLREGKYKIATGDLTAEQQAALPKGWVSESGSSIREIAEVLGDTPGVKLIDDLIATLKDQKASKIRPMDYRRKLIDNELEQRMEAKFGRLNENIIEQAKDQILSETQQQILHETVQAMAEKAGVAFPITKEQINKMVKETFDETPLKNANSDKHFAEAGRAGREMLDAVRKEDVAAAFRHSYHQYFAFRLAKEARKLEIAQEVLNKVAKTFRSEVVKSTEQAYTNFIHELLNQAGFKLKVGNAEIQASKNYEGHTSLDIFAIDKASYGVDIEVPQGYRPKALEDMTVGEFNEFKAAIDSLYDAGREEKKYNTGREKEEYADWKAGVFKNIRELPIRDIETAEKGGHWLYRLDSPMTRVEEMFKDLDLRKELGPLWSAVYQPFAMSKAKSFEMLEKLSKTLDSTLKFDRKWEKSLHDDIPQAFIYDVYNETGFKLTRWNMIKMMLNWGNESNAEKLVMGITKASVGPKGKVTKEMLEATRGNIENLFTTHATKEDWQFAQKIFDIFEGWRPEADNMSRSVSGKAIKWIEPREVVTPHGSFKGGYFPLFPDKLRAVGPGIKEGVQPTGSGPLGSDYVRAATSQTHYTKRTKAQYFVDLTSGPEQMVGRMQQIIHDISFRDFVVNTAKVLYDPEFSNVVKKHYGVEYEAQFIPWLKRIANQTNADERVLQGANDVLRRFRLNLTVSALPLNYSVMFSPSVGTLNLKNMLAFNQERSTNKAMVMANSKEIPHMLYNIDRDITDAMNQLLGSHSWTKFQLRATETMFKPLTWLEQQSRMATFYGEFMEQKGKGKTDFEAGAWADSIVRERHGVSHVGDLPAIMAHKNEFVKLSTMFMGYFTAQRNWMRQLPGEYRRGEYSAMAKTLWGTAAIAAIFNAALFTKRKEDEGLFKFLARSVVSVPMQMIPFGVRESWGYYSEGYKSVSPMLSFAVSVGEAVKDGVKMATGTRFRDLKHPIRDIANVLGQGAGVPGMVQAGRTGGFLYDVARKEQRPKDIVEWGRGILTGEAKLRK